MKSMQKDGKNDVWQELEVYRSDKRNTTDKIFVKYRRTDKTMVSKNVKSMGAVRKRDGQNLHKSIQKIG